MWINGQYYKRLEDIPIADLHTRQLLKLRSYCRGRSRDAIEEIVDKHTFCDRLKVELATREHVPSKRESREARKAKIKKGK